MGTPLQAFFIRINQISWTLVVFLTVSIASAQENRAKSSSEASVEVKASDLLRESTADDIDNQITNAKLRAESGSKSKHSTSFDSNYNGGTLEKPFGKTRPNLNSAAATDTRTSLSGSFGYRYRLNSSDSLTAGLGIKWLTPGHSLDKNESDRSSQQEAANPNLGYTKAFKSERFQHIVNGSFVKITSRNVIDREQTNYYFAVYHTGIYLLGTNGWQAGLTSYFDYYNYYTYIPGRTRSGEATASPQTEYDFGFSPFIEYTFNDKYNFRTIYRGNGYYALRDNRNTFKHMEPTQSMGIGMAIQRDIFLYPNIQWIWRDPRLEKTNIGLTATINM